MLAVISARAQHFPILTKDGKLVFHGVVIVDAMGAMNESNRSTNLGERWMRFGCRRERTVVQPAKFANLPQIKMDAKGLWP